MDRSDLLTDKAGYVVKEIDNLIGTLYSKNLYMTSWYGTLPRGVGIGLNKNGIKNVIKAILGRTEKNTGVGIERRGVDYEPILDVADDRRLPWYLYWEIFWVMKNGPEVRSNMRLLDAGGASSLFSCYLASMGCKLHSIDLNKALVSNGNRIAKSMGWSMYSYAMNIRKLDFEDDYFDHAYSICVFEHLDYETKQSALSEIGRCLKPNGILSITFDYRNPAPDITGRGSDTSEKNQIKNPDDIKRNFLSTGCFELLGNQEFYDNGKSYLINPKFGDASYTFGAIFLKKKS